MQATMWATMYVRMLLSSDTAELTCWDLYHRYQHMRF